MSWTIERLRQIPLSPLNACVGPQQQRTKVAIMGFGPWTRKETPVEDPAWEVWGLNHGYTVDALRDSQGRLRADRWWEMHPATEQIQPPDDLAWLRGGCPMPIYILADDPLVPNGMRYPIEQIEAMVPPGQKLQFACTFAYQIALAVLEGFEEIGLFGLDFYNGRELLVEAQNTAWWAGFAAGRGVTVTIPQGSTLCHHPAGVRYGYQYFEEIWRVDGYIAELEEATGTSYFGSEAREHYCAERVKLMELQTRG